MLNKFISFIVTLNCNARETYYLLVMKLLFCHFGKYKLFLRKQSVSYLVYIVYSIYLMK